VCVSLDSSYSDSPKSITLSKVFLFINVLFINNDNSFDFFKRIKVGHAGSGDTHVRNAKPHTTRGRLINLLSSLANAYYFNIGVLSQAWIMQVKAN
jgi:hypothetical protein